MELQRSRAKTEVPGANTDRKELAPKMFLKQDQRAVWILECGLAVLSERRLGGSGDRLGGGQEVLEKERP